jgi:putative ABC transport system permease protein
VLAYYFRLAVKGFRRTPGLTALMVCAIALGIGTCVVTLTVYHAMSGNPIWWKNNVLYAVTMDSWDPSPNDAYDPDHPELAPPQLTYRDAEYLYQSTIPRRKVMMTQLIGMLSGVPGKSVPIQAPTRATTRDFFSMFDVPFQFGGAWDAAADSGPQPVMVLSKRENEKLFGGANSVGQTVLWNAHRFRIVGVLADWRPLPRFYDLTTHSPWSNPDDVYVPFQWGPTLKQLPGGNSSCWGSNAVNTYEDFIGSECVWIEMWVELSTPQAREQMQAYMDSYWATQHKAGRFARPLNNHLTNVSGWLKVNGVVTGDSRILLRLAFAFLTVCLINTVGILLAKFLRAAPTSGLRRALGASRREIFVQHLAEVAAISLAGAALGLALGVAGLGAVRALYANSDGYSQLAHFDPLGIAWALGLAALSTLAAGLYPAWTVGRLPPSLYLKSR